MAITSSVPAPPKDLILLGYVSGAYGLGGWIRIKPYATESEVLLTAKTWWLDKPEFHDVDMLQAKMHGGDVVAQLMGVVNRDLAEGLRGAAVHVSRARFPVLADDEYYWVDLIGLDVENLHGEPLGRVADMMDNGAHPILRVVVSTEGAETGAMNAEDTPAELLIPFVDQFVKTVDQPGRKIVVDWGLDY